MYDHSKAKDGDKSDEYQIGTTAALFYYTNLKKNLYLYTGPRFGYANITVKDDNDDGTRDESFTNSYSIEAVLGLKYMLSESFAVFADMGISLYHEEDRDKDYDAGGNLTSDKSSHHTSVVLRSTFFGVAFYF